MRTYCVSEITSSIQWELERPGYLVSFIGRQIGESLKYQSKRYPDRIKFSNAIIIDKKMNRGDQYLRYQIRQWKVKERYGILNDISEM